MGMIDMALIERKDTLKWESYLNSGKKVIRDMSVLIHANVIREGDINNDI